MSQVKPMPPSTCTAARLLAMPGVAGEQLRGGRRAGRVTGAGSAAMAAAA